MKRYICFIFIFIFFGCQDFRKEKSNCTQYEISKSERDLILQVNKDKPKELEFNNLTICAIENDWQCLMELLIKESYYKNELDIEAYNGRIFKQSILSYACEKGRTEIVKMLLDAGQNIDQNSGCELMNFAVESGNLALVKTLYKAGASFYCEGEPVLINCNDEATTRYMLDMGIDVNFQTEVEQETLLHYEDSVESAKILVSYGAKLLKNSNGETALHYAAMFHNEPMVKYLMSIGADTNLKRNDGANALHCFFTCGDFENKEFYSNAKGSLWGLFRVLVDSSIDINAVDNKNQNYLHYAVVIEGVDNYVASLIAYKVNINHKNNNNQTPAHLAAEYGNIRYVKLLASGGADLTIKDDNGKTPIDIIKEKYSFLEIEKTK